MGLVRLPSRRMSALPICPQMFAGIAVWPQVNNERMPSTMLVMA